MKTRCEHEYIEAVNYGQERGDVECRKCGKFWPKAETLAKERGKAAELVDAAKAVVATATGNTYGLTEADQLEAVRMAARALDDALKALK